uniref:Uncharacterized protein AlNc14C46G3710 n=1 Tax=Albugo laibachii Nc14 TaxID=890382 RepID=F0WAI5_9STRA|nr:conserved hypothetical protein [Albugo laibachii Nc14]|eukprot:CCA18156.1 conserved hypothetical protein [Albugo laibachii Nc14]
MQDFHFSSACPWPQLRSKCVLERLQSNLKPHAHLSEILIEKCIVIAGHIALILKKNAKKAPNARSFMEVKADRNAPIRVLFVLDAVPPSHSATPSNPRSTTKRIPGPQADSNANADASEVEEIRIIEGLFQVSKPNKDGATIVKPPFLAARFDFRMIDIQFVKVCSALESRQSESFSKQSYTSFRSILRCVAAREDGVAYVWEWKADLFQWKYLNRFCYLNNPNLSWTKPVLSFGAFGISQKRCESYESNTKGGRDMMEMAWWSTESNKDPELWFRKIIFEQDVSTFRTGMILGNALSGSAQTILAMITSHLGIWIVSKRNQSVRILLRSSQTFGDAYIDVECDENPKWSGCCLHFTGQLLVLLSRLIESKGKHSIYRIHQKDDCSSLEKHFVCEMDDDECFEGKSVQLACHRQLFLILKDRECHIFSLITGVRLQSLQLPATQIDSHFAFWSTSGISSAIGIWNNCGVWWLRLPDAKKLLTMLKAKKPQQRISFILSHGANLKMEFIDAALDVLRSDPSALEHSCKISPSELLKYIGNPALLLASVRCRGSHNVVDQVSALVTFIFQTIKSITKKTQITNLQTSDPSMLFHLTPSNIENLPHLCSWVFIVKRRAQLWSLEDEKTTIDSDCLKQKVDEQAASVKNTMRSSFALNAQSMLEVAKFCLSIDKVVRDDFPASDLISSRTSESETTSSLRRLSLSKNLAFELFCRVYLHQNPMEIAQYLRMILSTRCSRPINARAEAERVLLILPPKKRYIDNLQAARRLSIRHKESVSSTENTMALRHAEECVHAYSDLLVQSGNAVEACQLLLDCDLHETCLKVFLRLRRHAVEDISPALQYIYFDLLRHCVQHRGGKELSNLLSIKPKSTSVTRVLHTLLSSLPPDTSRNRTKPQISLESIRPILRQLLVDSMPSKAKNSLRTSS